MTALRRSAAVALAVSLACIAPLSAADPDDARLRGEADHAFDAGTAHYDAGRFADARASFAIAWRIKKTHDVAANLGLCEMRLGLWRDAAEHLAFALETSPPTDATERRRLVEQRLADARSRVATYRVTANMDDAEIVVGGIAVGRTRAGRPVEVFAEPGARTLVVSGGGVEQRVDVSGVAGQSRDVEIALRRAPAPVLADTRPPRAIANESVDAPSVLPKLVLGGVGLVAAGVGIGFLVAAGSRTDDADSALADLRARTGSSAPCPSATEAAACQSIHALRTEHDTFSNVGVGMLVGGGAALAASAIWWALDGGALAAPSSGGVRLAPQAGREGGGVWLRGRF